MKTVEISVLLLMILMFWGCKDDSVNPGGNNEPIAEEFVILPENPTMKDDIKMVFYGCSYFNTTSVVAGQNSVHVKKHFNSLLQWPCAAEYDTISLGKQHKGEYEVKLDIIDLNPNTPDSVYYSRTKTITVSNK